MSVQARKAAHQAANARAARAYTDDAFPRPAMATPADLQAAFLAGCSYVQHDRARNELADAVFTSDGLIELRFGAGSSVQISPETLHLHVDNVARIAADRTGLCVEFREPVSAAPGFPPEDSISYSVNYLRAMVQVERRKATDTL